MGIINYINGSPLFSNAKEALAYAKDIGFRTDGVHVHKYSTGINLFRTGYMPGSTHEELERFIKTTTPTDPRDPRDPKDSVDIKDLRDPKNNGVVEIESSPTRDGY